MSLASINEARSQRGQSILYCAARNGSFEVARWLLSLGVESSTAQAPNGSTPLHGACFGAHKTVVALLLASGADPEVQNSLGKTPVEEAGGKTTKSIIAKFKEAGTIDESQLPPHPTFIPKVKKSGSDSLDSKSGEEACTAAFENNVSKLQTILEKISISSINSFRSTRTQSIMYAACRNGSYDVVNWLLTLEGLEVSSPQGPNSSSPLHAASFSGNKGVVVLLLLGGADIKLKNSIDKTPLEESGGVINEILTNYSNVGWLSLHNAEKKHAQLNYLSILYGNNSLVFDFKTKSLRDYALSFLEKQKQELEMQKNSNFDVLLKCLWDQTGSDDPLQPQQALDLLGPYVDRSFTPNQQVPAFNLPKFYQLGRKARSITDQNFISAYFKKYATHNENSMTQEEFQNFLSEEQKVKDAKSISVSDIFSQLCPSYWSESQEISYELFCEYLLSDLNSATGNFATSVNESMHLPLSQYLASSSHNTYCSEDQLYGKSTTEMYARALAKERYRCVELDTWDGDSGQPDIYHGYTLTSKIKFRDVIKAIGENAFAYSPYPIVLSFENHCSQAQQEVMANDLVEILGNMLGVIPENTLELPSPDALKYKILLKGSMNDVDTYEIKQGRVTGNQTDTNPYQELIPKTAPALSKICYLAAKPLDLSGNERCPFDISSAAEASEALFQDIENTWKYTSTRTIRIYPKGTRFDSSNYDPVPFWNVGAQFVALNIQTCSLPTMVNLGKFSKNGGCGFTLKSKELPTQGTDKFILNIKVLKVTNVNPHSKDKEIFLKMNVNGIECDNQELETTKCPIVGSYAHPTHSASIVVYAPEEAVLTLRFDKKKTERSEGKDQAENLVGFASLPFSCLQEGVRKIQLYDGKMQPMPWTCALVYISISKEKAGTLAASTSKKKVKGGRKSTSLNPPDTEQKELKRPSDQARKREAKELSDKATIQALQAKVAELEEERNQLQELLSQCKCTSYIKDPFSGQTFSIEKAPTGSVPSTFTIHILGSNRGKKVLKYDENTKLENEIKKVLDLRQQSLTEYDLRTPEGKEFEISLTFGEYLAKHMVPCCLLHEIKKPQPIPEGVLGREFSSAEHLPGTGSKKRTKSTNLRHLGKKKATKDSDDGLPSLLFRLHHEYPYFLLTDPWVR